MVQWVRLHISNAGDMGSITGHVTKIPYAAQCGKKIQVERAKVILKTPALPKELQDICKESDQVSGGMLAKDERPNSSTWRREHR